MTFDLGWPWPWPPTTNGGSRATPGASLVKIGAGVSEIYMVVTLKWPLVISVELSCKLVELSYKFQDFIPSDLGPWMTLTLTPL